jgi:hypothetical protein
LIEALQSLSSLAKHLKYYAVLGACAEKKAIQEIAACKLHHMQEHRLAIPPNADYDIRFLLERQLEDLYPMPFLPPLESDFSLFKT